MLHTYQRVELMQPIQYSKESEDDGTGIDEEWCKPLVLPTCPMRTECQNHRASQALNAKDNSAQPNMISHLPQQFNTKKIPSITASIISSNSTLESNLKSL